MHIPLDNHRIECGEELRWDYVGMPYYIEFWIRHIEPFRRISGTYEVDFPYPRGELLDSSEPIFQESIIAETGIYHPVFFNIGFTGLFIEFLFPIRVVHIDPCHNEIYVHNQYPIWRFPIFINLYSLRITKL